MNAEDKLYSCWESIKSKIPFIPSVAVVLGSGLGGFAETINQTCIIRYSEINGFPLSTVEGHKGQYVFGYAGDVPVVLMQGRVHFYEGYDMSDVVLPVRLMKLMGAQFLILTNAAGGINSEFCSGDLMMITDQISSFVPNCLTGPNISSLGERFPDMTEIYDKKLCSLIRSTASSLSMNIREGTYVQLSGPSYETPAEIRMLGTLGADAVGMSTACEAIAAKHMNMRICGISFISNPAAGLSEKKLCHEDVQNAANQAEERFTKLITHIIYEIDTATEK